MSLSENNRHGRRRVLLSEVINCIEANFHTTGFPDLFKPAPVSLYVVQVQIGESIVVPQTPTHSPY